MLLDLADRSRQVTFRVKVMFLVLTLLLSLFLAAFAAAPAKAAGTLVINTPTISYGQLLSISGGGFASSEQISIRAVAPAGAAAPVLAGVVGPIYTPSFGGDMRFMNASSNGDFTSFSPAVYFQSGTPGVYTLQLRGLTSGTTASATFTLRRPILRGAGATSGGVSALIFVGAYWFPGEKVSFWFTDANGAVGTRGNGYVWADLNGLMPAAPDNTVVTVTNAPVPITLTAFGNTSKQTVTLTYVVSTSGVEVVG